jgi:DNA-binding NtrC family response regulator
VRELRGTLEGMVAFVERNDRSRCPTCRRRCAVSAARWSGSKPRSAHKSTGWRQLIAATLRYTRFDKPRAAAMLGIGLRTLYRKIQRYRLGQGN